MRVASELRRRERRKPAAWAKSSLDRANPGGDMPDVADTDA
jgi:hypothetical protein